MQMLNKFVVVKIHSSYISCVWLIILQTGHWVIYSIVRVFCCVVLQCVLKTSLTGCVYHVTHGQQNTVIGTSLSRTVSVEWLTYIDSVMNEPLHSTDTVLSKINLILHISSLLSLCTSAGTRDTFQLWLSHRSVCLQINASRLSYLSRLHFNIVIAASPSRPVVWWLACRRRSVVYLTSADSILTLLLLPRLHGQWCDG